MFDIWDVEFSQIMRFTTIPTETRVPLVQASLADVPIGIVAPRAVVELSYDALVTNVAIVLWVYFDEVVLPFAIACLALSQTVTTDVVVTGIALLAVSIWTANNLIADVAFEIDFHIGILSEV